MKRVFGWFCGLCLISTLLIAAGTAAFSGCYYETVCECPPCDDGGPGGDGDGDSDADPDAGEAWQQDWVTWREDSAPNAEIQGYGPGTNYITLEPGASITLNAGECVIREEAENAIEGVTFLPCTYRWEFGDGRTAEGETSGAISYSGTGFYVVSLIAINAYGIEDSTPTTLHIAVWDGEFSDDFNRGSLDHNSHGWGFSFSEILELGADVGWDIEGNRLHAHMNDCLPAATGLIAWPETQDIHVEFFQERNPSEEHWTDVIVRLQYHGEGETAPITSFYRIRIWEDGPDGAGYHGDGRNCVQIDIFRSTTEDGEFGVNIRGGDGLTNFTDQPFVCDWPRDANFRVEVDVVGDHFDVVVTSPDNPSLRLEEHVDDPTPIIQSGRFGLGHCVGISYFDDYAVRSLD